MTAETVALALGGHKAGSGWMARCPTHDDREPSLAIRDADDGRVLVRCHATAVRKVFRTAFERVGLPYVNPHSVRNTLTQRAYKLQLNPEQFKAWSQNMGHDKPLTTLNSYGHVSIERQEEIIRGLRHQQPAATPDDAMAEKIAEKVAAKMRGQGQY